MICGYGPDLVNVAAVEPRSVVNGPGERFVVWVQGCPFRCKGCYNRSFLTFGERNLVSPEQLAQEILATPSIRGVTFSGGEPMTQAAALAAIAKRVRAEGMDVVCFTGFTYEYLNATNEPGVQDFLSQIDLLIDGRFVEKLRGSLRWRGSLNQRLIPLSERIDVALPEGNEIELIVGRGSIRSSGILNEEILRRLEEELNA